MRESNAAGFTIVELMIATSIFSVILLLCATSLVQIGKFYYKGVNTSRSQEAARNIMEEIQRPLQFSNPIPIFGGPSVRGTIPNVYSICIGSTRFSYVADMQVNDNGTVDVSNHLSPHAMWRDTMNNTGLPCSPADLSSANPSTYFDVNTSDGNNGKELVPLGMRLTKQVGVSPVAGSMNLWNVNVEVLYGDDVGILRNAASPFDIIGCKSVYAGGVFCGFAPLHTQVFRRLLQ